MTEEDVKFQIISPAIEKAGWKKTQIKMEEKINQGKIIQRNNIAKRLPSLKADYVLYYKDQLPLAVVEAKNNEKIIGEGMQQAKNYAAKLDIRFAYTSNGNGFLEYDMKTGIEKKLELDQFPSPKDLYNRQYGAEIVENEDFRKILNTPYYFGEDTFPPRHYQRIAINKTVEAISKKQDKILLVLATGTGKTYIAFQIIWRLWKSGLKKKILYLADRNILLDQTIMGDFKPFKNSMVKISNRKMNTSYEIYLALYQQLSENNNDDTLKNLKDNFKEDFFDLIVIDECHRGSAREDSNWRKILDYFRFATKIGMTATPKETKEVSNIDYFGEPIYTYSLKDGIEDGYLAPYRVIRYAFDTDIYGYRPEKGKTDIKGNLIEDKEYAVENFDKDLVIEERTKLVAKVITEYLKETSRWNKTIVFCVDIDHAERMRHELVNLNSDLYAKNHNYIMKITGDDEEGKKQLDNFIDVDSPYPTIVTTSKLLTTGVNCKTCKNIVLDNNFGENGMIEFKQIIGRGTRILDDQKHDKKFFTILDFRNATRLFADPNFNGPEIQCDDYQSNLSTDEKENKLNLNSDNYFENDYDFDTVIDNKKRKGNKYYINGVPVKLITKKVQFYDKNGKLITESLKDFTKKSILNNYVSYDDFLKLWTSDKRKQIIKEELHDKGIFLDELKKLYPLDIDYFDLICDIAYGINPLTKKERVNKNSVKEMLETYSDKCKEILKILLDKYQKNEIEDLSDPKILKLPEFNEYGNFKIISFFGGKNDYLKAVQNIQNSLYK